MVKHHTKFIFVTGGVISSLGKGIAAASIGALLESRGLQVTILKLDPYLNVDPGTMNPFQHGEVFVTSDGTETDLDLGHYERYLNKDLGKVNSVTAGQIYQSVLDKERAGDYLGNTVQVIPHVTDQIKAAIYAAAAGYDVLICEVGGTVGDIESLPFLETIRQMRGDEGYKNTVFIHASYVPILDEIGEIKTKPTQHSVKELLGIGIQPDVLLLRAGRKIPSDIKKKIALFCNVPEKQVVSCPNLETVYEVPLLLREEGIDDILVEHLNIWARAPNLSPWKHIVNEIKNPQTLLSIAVVGKYTSLAESYKSIHEALVHAGIENHAQAKIVYIDADDIEAKGAAKMLKHADAILVPGGFGQRGINGKIAAVKYAREHKVPFLGICLGLQIAVIEFARNVAKLNEATSQEFDEHADTQVIHIMEDQKRIHKKGGTMRLGNYETIIQPHTLAHKIYQHDQIVERHRHRFEVNNSYRDILALAGLVFSGLSPDKDLVEIVEISNHPFFIACQSHPEFQSRPLKPHPLFVGFIAAAIDKKNASV